MSKSTPTSSCQDRDLRAQVERKLAACVSSAASQTRLNATWMTSDNEIVSVVLDVGAVDRLSCELKYLELSTCSTRTMKPDELKSVADRLSDRLQYLLEPLATLEVDREGLSAQLRSSPPERTTSSPVEHADDQPDRKVVRYFEVNVTGNGSLTFCRYEKPAGERRRSVVAVLTHEVLGRLCDDLATVVAEL